MKKIYCILCILCILSGCSFKKNHDVKILNEEKNEYTVLLNAIIENEPFALKDDQTKKNIPLSMTLDLKITNNLQDKNINLKKCYANIHVFDVFDMKKNKFEGTLICSRNANKFTSEINGYIECDKTFGDKKLNSCIKEKVITIDDILKGNDELGKMYDPNIHKIKIITYKLEKNTKLKLFLNKKIILNKDF